MGAEFTKVYADEHGSLAAGKAAEATAKKGEGDAAAPPLAADVPDYSGLARTAQAQQEVDQRVALAVRRLLRQVLLLAAVSLSEGWARRRLKRAKKSVKRD